MGKLELMHEYRNQGMGLAHKIVEQAQKDGLDPLAVLDSEISKRHALDMTVVMTRQEWEKEFAAAMELAYKAAMVIAMAVLWG